MRPTRTSVLSGLRLEPLWSERLDWAVLMGASDGPQRAAPARRIFRLARFAAGRECRNIATLQL
jgi:hypothetical protein